MHFLRQATPNNCTPVKLNIDKSGFNTSAFRAYNDEAGTDIEIWQCKYLNNIVKQSHRSVKHKTRAALGVKAFHCAHATFQGVEVVQMIRKRQVRPVSEGSFIDQFNSLAA